MKTSTLTKTLIIASTTFLMACGGASKSTSGDKPTLDGIWEVVKADGSMAEMNVGTKYIFEGASLTFSKDGMDNKASSTHTDSTFTWNNGTMVMDYDYKFNGNQLLVMPKGGDQTLYLDKK